VDAPHDHAYWAKVDQQLDRMYDAFDASGCTAWKEGYRAGRELPYTSEFTVTIVTPNGPWKNKPVEVDYVYGFLPPELRQPGLWATRTREERDGTSWSLRYSCTDENGTVHFDRLPCVQCKVIVGMKEIVTYPTGDLRIDYDPPPNPFKDK